MRAPVGNTESPNGRHLVDPELLDLLDTLPAREITAENLAEVRATARGPAPAQVNTDVAAVAVSARLVPGPQGAPAVPLRVYQPSRAVDQVGCIFHMHGGGYVNGNAAALEPIHRKLSADLGCVIVSVDYRRAPETIFPGNIEDCYAGLYWSFNHAPELNVDDQRIGVMGESSGGGLAAALALLARDRGEMTLAFQHLICPMLDDRTCVVEKPHPFTGEYVWTARNNHFGWSALLGTPPGSKDISHYAAPARAQNLVNLPPAFISTSALDLFLEEDIEYARRLLRAGVPVELHVYPGGFHGFELHPTAKIAQAAQRNSLAALARFLESPLPLRPQLVIGGAKSVDAKRLQTIESPVGAEIVLDGRRYINFGGSSYLGLSANVEIIEAGLNTLRESGGGYQFHRSYGIATRAHQEAESQAALFFDTKAALYLAAGYYFGLVSIAAMRNQFSTIFFDEWAHHSLREAIAASGLENYPFRHLDVGDLETKLKLNLRSNQRPLIVTDGLYSTFGEIAPLEELAHVMESYEGRLLVDESHSFGVLGKLGRGASEHHNMPASSVVIGGSTGKAFGVVGGVIPASEDEVSTFRRASAGRGAAAGLAAAASMCAKSLRYIRDHPELLLRLRASVAYMKTGLRKIGLDVGDSVAPVATFRCEGSMQTLQERLMSEGILVFHSTYIGAGANGVIRCGIFADHTREHIDRLLDALRRLL